MELPTLYYEKNVFCPEPLQKKGKFKIPAHNISSPVTEFHPSSQRSLRCQEIYIQNVAGGLHFSKEVIKDRGLASLSYQEWDSKDVYNASNVIQQKRIRTLSKIRPKQHKLIPTNHHVGHVETPGPFKKLKAKSCIGFESSLWRKHEEDEQRQGSLSHLTVENRKPKTFLTEEATILTHRMKVPHEETRSASHTMPDDYTEVLLKKLTKPTAQRIVGHHIESKGAKERLSKSYGLTKSTELINDDHMTEEDLTTFKELQTYKPKERKDITEEHKPETLLPVFYKIPGYLSPQKQVQDVGGKNKTADSLAIKHFELPPPLSLQDLMNPKAGKYFYATENDFERELYSGVGKIIHQKDTKQKNCIIMDSNSSYEKHVQQSVPRSYKEWMASDGQTDIERPWRPKRGALRWVALPTVALDKKERSPQKETSTNVLSDGDTEPKDIKPGPLTKKQVLQNIVTQWRSAWLLSVHWKDATLEQLTRDLGNIHNSHKISALITIASSAIEALRQIAFPPEILNLVSSALQEEDDLVKMAAALCQYFMREVNEEARKIMFKSLESGTDADSWAAAQCLALEGNHSYLVIKRILDQMFAATNKETERQALYILHELSKHTKLIHAMLGEALNSGNWGERVMSCKALSTLHGNISQGVKDKLSHLMWNDWSPAVRGAAAKALGKLDQGKEVHDQIRKHLESDSWKKKVEALTLIGFLQIMTAQLLPGFLQCFHDDFLAVRRQACRTAGLLQIKDDMVMNCLYQLVRNDPVWKIKAHAIKASGKIGHLTPRVKELLLWAMRVEEPGVRIEAYRCIASLNLRDFEIQHALQDRLILESEELVRSEVRHTLTALNLAHNGNQDMMSQVKHQLSKLCQKEVLFPKVLKMGEDLSLGETKLEQILLKTPNCKNKTREQEIFWDNVGKETSGQSCPSVMSGMEYKSTDSELQVLMESESRPSSPRTVNPLHVASELSFTTAGTRPSTDRSHCN
ncbi:HEAT repeat-containing protein 4 [Hyla sarda]|uniref:HEAT repeat-containing protein 4 n=1 Tax=Hyla sarda TaxID=327740 RepID=UPI0024C325B3|nr:HEAT repeat-containing protein 4 [Hyla sarda]XP_056402449.1 HEAT repeat-containing protein 4 [Hyla sarda]XP_056402450.1 HEAT repeat-containing protein 4 [Hyla sarda]